MADDFKYDVFLSHSSKDKAIVHAVAERLRADGIRVWFDDWEIRAGDSIPAKIEEGLERSRVLVLCMSANAFGSDWAQLESGTFRFRDPLNKGRRFIPLRLDDSSIKGSLRQFLYINWVASDREQEYGKLLETCRPPPETVSERLTSLPNLAEMSVRIDAPGEVQSYAFSPDGKRAFCATSDKLQHWDFEGGHCLREFKSSASERLPVVLSVDERLVISGGFRIVELWNAETGRRRRTLADHTAWVQSLALSPDQRLLLTGAQPHSIMLWDVETGSLVREFSGHSAGIWGLAWSADQKRAISGSYDNTLRLWDVKTGRSLRVLNGHTAPVRSVAWSLDQTRAISGSDDQTVRLWAVNTGNSLRVLEGHTGRIKSVALSKDSRFALSGSADRTVRLWDLDTGRCLRVLEGLAAEVKTVAWIADGKRVISGDASGGIQIWDVSTLTSGARPTETSTYSEPDQIQYTNAKVLLVGDSGAGKTGLSMRLALNDWQPSDSTVGAWATQWKLPISSRDDVEREIWLWDFGGQADQRLIHQLYMDDTSLAVLVFDGQKEDIFETLGQWDRDITRASSKEFSKLLVAGRVDAGGLRVSRSQILAFTKERGYRDFLETSAKTNLRCEELKQAILLAIRWEKIPWHSSPLLFKRLKDEIVRLKDEGKVLMRFNELRATLQLRLMHENLGEVTRFSDEELTTVLSLLAGPAVVWELKFGSWVLLQPERINAYAQAVIQTMRADGQERGCLTESRVLSGDLLYQSTTTRLGAEEERFMLLAMHQTLVERGLCLREHTDKGALLVFPSYYQRERPELVGHPAVLVSYRFNGFLEDIYATLVVRLHHTAPFEQDQLWRYAADFKTLTGKQVGVKMTRRAEGAGELDVYFDPTVEGGEKIIFSKYVHEHLLKNATDVVRLRYYICPRCGTPVGNREVAMKRLNTWLESGAGQTAKNSPFERPRTKLEKPTIVCSECEERVPLWDDLEKHFASSSTKQRVRELEEQSAIVLDNESKERVLVGEVISTVALAGQISREFNVSDHGIDMEIEFKSDDGEATGQKIYLQLKSGDSYLRERKRDGAEIFNIRDERHARYWSGQAFPVLLVIRTSDGQIRWMDIREWLRRASDDVTTTFKQIVFEGERFDAMSVRRWREVVLGPKHS